MSLHGAVVVEGAATMINITISSLDKMMMFMIILLEVWYLAAEEIWNAGREDGVPELVGGGGKL